MRNKAVQRILNQTTQALSRSESVDIEAANQTIADLKQQIQELKVALETATERSKVNNRKLLEAAIEEEGLNPVHEMVRMANSEEVSTAQKLAILKELCSYMLPKVKQQEHVHDHSHNIRVVVNNFGDPVSQAIDATPAKHLISR